MVTNNNLLTIDPVYSKELRSLSWVLILLVIAVITLMLVPSIPQAKGIASYLPLHTLLESVSAVIAVLIFAVGWTAYRNEHVFNILILSSMFLGVAILDFSHTLSYAGMPDYVTPSSSAKAINFWLAARFMAALALFIITISSWNRRASSSMRSKLFAVVLAAVLLVHWLVLFHMELLPATFIPGMGLTTFKISAENFIIFINVITALLLLLKMRSQHSLDIVSLFAAVCVMALSEFLFTLYADVTDLYNLMGHIFKLISYYYLYRAIFKATIEHPYHQLTASQNQLQATFNAIPDMVLEVGLSGHIYSYHPATPDLNQKTHDFYVGHNINEVCSKVAATECMTVINQANTGSYLHRSKLKLPLGNGSNWYELSVSKKQAEKGKEPSFIVIFRDISGFVKAEQDLRISEQKLLLILDNVDAYIYLKDMNGHYQFANKPVRELWNASMEEIVGYGDEKFFDDQTVQKLRDIDSRVLKHGETIHEEEVNQVKDTDDKHYYLTTKLPLRRDDGTIYALCGISFDITKTKHDEIKLRNSEALLREAQYIANLGSYVLDIKTGQWSSSEVLNLIFGVDENHRRTIDSWEQLIYPDDRRMMDHYFKEEVIAQGHEFDKEYRIIRQADLSVRWVHGLGRLETDPEGNPVKMHGTIQDITNRKKTESLLYKLSTAVEQSPNSIVITDIKGTIEYVNTWFTNITGYSRMEALGKNPRILKSGKTLGVIYSDMWGHLTSGKTWHGELINHRKDGSEYIESATITPIRDSNGVITNYLAIKEDITEKKKAEEQIEKLAHFDHLTELPNRTFLNSQFEYILGLSQRNQESFALMFLDLDRFKNINDTLGHKVGDQVLILMAQRLKKRLREQDVISRLGGDEFVFILPGTDFKGATRVAQILVDIISEPYQIDQHELTTTPSIGIAIYPDDGIDLDTLMKNADTAMYRVKDEGRNAFCFYTAEMQKESARSMLISNALRHALSNDELDLHYQPQTSLKTGKIIGIEALLRWQHPEMGFISPAEFVSIAEDNGQIIQIGEWVIRKAAHQLRLWLDQGLPELVMAINISAVQFKQANITQVLKSILDQENLPYHLIELELTEAVAMSDPDTAIAIMDQLNSIGVRLSIDDFGTGYSSLNYLKKFKINRLKIDQSFIRDITVDNDDRAIVNAIINMSKSLGIDTIAEGVETKEQLEMLKEQGCDEVQGYYLSRPLTTDKIEEYIKANHR